MHNYQQTECKEKTNKANIRTGTESQKWGSHGGLLVGSGGEWGKRYRE